MDLNTNTVLFLANKNCRAVKLAYHAFDADGNCIGTGESRYDGKPVGTDIFKTLDPTISVGDMVLGETQSRHKLGVYRVFAVDVDVNLEHSAYIPWVVGRIQSNLRDLKSQEDQMIAVIRQKDKEKKRAELAETMLKDYGAELQKLGITDLPSTPQIGSAPTAMAPRFDPFTGKPI